MTKKNNLKKIHDELMEKAIKEAEKLLLDFNLFYMKYGIFPHEIWDKILNKHDKTS